MNSLFKNNREDFEAKWNNIKIVIEYGMLSEDKFFEKADKFALYPTVDGNYFTFEELKEKIKKIAQWQLQQNPWLVYKQQLLDMGNQCLRLQKDYRVLLNVASNFDEIEALVRKTENFCQAEIANVQKIANETVDGIKQEQIPKLPKIIKHLEDLEAGIRSSFPVVQANQLTTLCMQISMNDQDEVL